jgi:hypothetical protein
MEMTTRELLQRTLEAMDYAQRTMLNEVGIGFIDVLVIEEVRAHLAEPDETAELLREMGNSLQILDDNYEEMEGEDGLVAVVPLSLANLCSEALAKYREVTK